jgi:hypothetical protein
VSFKAFVAAKNKLTLYRLHHAEMLIDHTVSCNSGASSAVPLRSKNSASCKQCVFRIC